MRRISTWFATATLILAVATLAGCGPEKKPAEKPKPEEHVHAPHGPNGGHVVELTSPDKKGAHYHAEWLFDDDAGKFVVIMLDHDMKNEEGVDAEVANVDIKTGDKTETTVLPAANRTSGEKPTATRFELVDQKLVTILAGDNVDAKIRMTIGGAEFSGKIEHHKH